MKVEVLHASVRGRVRYRVDGLHRSERLKRRIEFDLSGVDGVHSVSANALTGTVLVLFNSNNSHDSVAVLLARIGPRDEMDAYGARHPAADRSQPQRSHRGENGLSAVTNHHGSDNHNGTTIAGSDVAWHLIDADAVLDSLAGSKALGLSSEAARERLKQYGPNLISGAESRSGWSMFVDQFTSLPVGLLGAAAAVSLATGGVADALVILGVITINAGIGYFTESQAERTIQSLKSLVRPTALVIRDGGSLAVRAEEVVPGDILVLKPGTYISADARLAETSNLHVDESALTGESLPVFKSPDLLPAGAEYPLADRVNMAYMGTLVTGGSGLAVVVGTGRSTEIGRIQTLVGDAEPPQTSLEKQLDHMGNQLVLISGAVCGFVFLIGLLRGYGLLQMFKTSISLAVAAVPEGLPTVATTTLALGIRNMRRRHVLIRRLEAVETLGSVQTICLDKTGTITMNRMSVVAVHTGRRSVTVQDGRFTAGAQAVSPYTCDELLRLLHVAALCSETELDLQDGEYVLRGSPTENALVQMGLSAGVDVFQLRTRHPILKMTHRAENQNFMSTLHLAKTGGEVDPSLLFALKGSPPEVLAMCHWQVVDGKVVPLSADDRLAIEIENERMSGRALRVLGTAYARVGSDWDPVDVRDGLVWLGLIGMADPIRQGVKDLIHSFHRAGIRTVMITGDQSPTAQAIGQELNLNGADPLEILDSTHLTKIEPDVMAALGERVQVFARVSPAHKLQIVQAIQRAGRVVAMTGDGINDGPALKAADIGIAMGHTGTDVAREVADMILEDDSLETMIVAVSHGRTIYNNIRKSVHFLLATNLSEIMVMFVALAGGLGQPLNAMQLLWINLVTDIFPGLALALEPPEPDVLRRAPRDPQEPIVKTSDFKRIGFEAATLSAGSLAAYGYGIVRYGIGPRAGTMAFLSLTCGQLLHAISCRSERHSLFDRVGSGQEPLPPNRYLQAAVAGSFALQAVAMAVPGLRSLLGIAPIGLLDGVVVGGSAVLPLVINEATKRPPALNGDANNSGSNGTPVQP